MRHYEAENNMSLHGHTLIKFNDQRDRHGDIRIIMHNINNNIIIDVYFKVGTINYWLRACHPPCTCMNYIIIAIILLFKRNSVLCEEGREFYQKLRAS